VSFLEQVLAADLDRLGIAYEREVRIVPDRRWRADFKLVDAPTVLIEIEGGTSDKWFTDAKGQRRRNRGRHIQGEGYEDDAAKYSRCAREGYIVLRFTSKQVQGRMMPGSESEAVETILAALRYWKEETA
jgi:very-short-patch-repair endonuclease